MKLIKNIQLLSAGKGDLTDILLAGDKIAAIGKSLDTGNLRVERLDMEGAIATPGLIDIHVHTSGGGGQAGFFSLAPEVRVEDLVRCGTTSVVGLLGTDGFVKQLPQLYAKTMSLRMNKISAYMLTGYYGLPTPTLTDCIANDLIFIDPVIGCKIAICDDRSSFPSEDDLIRIISQVRLGGFTSAKRGVMHVHLGGLPEGMQVLIDIARRYPSLIDYISPTHTIRTEFLFHQAIEFARMGGMIDISTGGTQYVEPYQGVLIALKEGVPIRNMTFSSDGNGGVKRVDPLTGEETYTLAPLHRNLEQVVKLITEGGIPPEEAFLLVTENAARTMSLKNKGKIAVGYDADLCFFDPGYRLCTVVSRGAVMMENGVAKKGSFES